MVDGNMAVGVTGDELMVRIGKDAHEEAIARPGARTFDLSAKPMQGWVVVSADGLATDADANCLDRPGRSLRQDSAAEVGLSAECRVDGVRH